MPNENRVSLQEYRIHLKNMSQRPKLTFLLLSETGPPHMDQDGLELTGVCLPVPPKGHLAWQNSPF